MAAALFGGVLEEVAAAGDLDEPVAVVSAGLLESGHPVPPEVVKAVASYGADLTPHRSTQLTADVIESADLVLGMERRHGREVVLLVPSAWTRTFTLKEFVRRGEKVGPRRRRQPLRAWLSVVGDERQRTDLVGRSVDDDVADPLGGDPADFRATAAELADLVQRLARLLWSDGGRADS
jgi:protein-tyrosine phosphatase